MSAPPPSTLPDLHRAFIANAVDALAADPRVVAIAAAGSYADDETPAGISANARRPALRLSAYPNIVKW
jgi:hypothetical protein